MPIRNNEGLDDATAYDYQQAFGGGQVSFARSNLLGPTQATVLRNTEVERAGTISQRRGFHRLGDLKTASDTAGGGVPQGLFWFDQRGEGTQYALAVVGGRLFKLDDTHAWSLVSSTVATSTTDPLLSGVQIATRFWLASDDGSGRARVWTAAELAAGSAGASITDGPTNLGALTALKHRLFGVNSDLGDEVFCSRTLPDSTAPFTLSGQPILPFRVGEGEGDPVVAFVVWKGLFSLIALKRESIWMIDATSQSTVAATLTAGFATQRIAQRVGCMARRSVVVGGNDVFFLAADGVRSLERTIQDGDGEISDPLSLPVQDIIDRINPDKRDLCCGAFWRGKYILAVPVDSSPIPNTVLVFDVAQKAWSVWDGIQPIAWTVASFTGQSTRLLCLDSRGHVLEYRDALSPGATTPSDYRDTVTGSEVRIPYAVRSRAMTSAEPLNPKIHDFVELEFDRSEAVVDIAVYLDNDAGQVIARKLRTGYGTLVVPPDDSPDVWVGSKGNYFVLECRLGELKVKRVRFSLLHLPAAREIMIEVRESADLTASEASESGILRFRQIMTGAFVDTLEEHT